MNEEDKQTAFDIWSIIAKNQGLTEDEIHEKLEELKLQEALDELVKDGLIEMKIVNGEKFYKKK